MNDAGSDWFEVWTEDREPSPPYFWLVRPDSVATGRLQVLDPAQGDAVVFESADFGAVKMWRLEDKLELVGGSDEVLTNASDKSSLVRTVRARENARTSDGWEGGSIGGLAERAADPWPRGETIRMGESFFIVAEMTAEGGKSFLLGGSFVHCHPVGAGRRPDWAPFRHLDALAREAGVQPLSEFISADPETAGWRFFGDMPVEPPPPSRWFMASEGLATVRGLLDYLTTHTERVADVRQVIAELRSVEEVLRHLDNKGVLWHLEDGSWW